MELSSVNALASATPPTSSADTDKALGTLGSQDFLRLLIAQLQTQDPLEPVSNQDLLNQISSIRDIELSTTLTSSLSDLANQQQFGSASSLIGQFVTGSPGADGLTHSGLVVGVRFPADGSPVLQLADGSELPISRLSAIESPSEAARALMGQGIVGVDRRDTSSPEVVSGVVSGVRLDEAGDVLLELDTGMSLRLRDFTGLVPVAAA